MPAARPLENPADKKEREARAALRLADLQEVQEELALYDPSGPWRFFERRLLERKARAQEALATGPLEEIQKNRAILKFVNDLLDVPNELARTRALLEEEM